MHDLVEGSITVVIFILKSHWGHNDLTGLVIVWQYCFNERGADEIWQKSDKEAEIDVGRKYLLADVLLGKLIGRTETLVKSCSYEYGKKQLAAGLIPPLKNRASRDCLA